MKTIIVYGYGRKYQKIKQDLFGCRIIAFADSNAKSMMVDGTYDEPDVSLILPDEIQNYEYDYVAISVFGAFEKIKQQLIGENHVPEEKIISLALFWRGNASDTEAAEASLQELFLRRDGCRHKINSYTNFPEEELDGKRYTLANALLIDEDESDRDDEAHQTTDSHAKIYVVAHAPYGVLRDDLYTPITVGAYHRDGYLWEQNGENISRLNDRINECTALYWIWKNSDADIVGMNHYHRFFYNNELRCRENRLDEKTIRMLLSENDIIVYRGKVPGDAMVKEEMLWDLPKDVFDYGYEHITRHLKEHQPDYLDDLYAIMQEKTCCYCHMFVTRKEIFDAYCAWLFSFLIPAAESANLSGYDAHEKRIIGYFAERMLSTWLHHNPKKEVTLPVYIP